jgi:membrane-bound lytic murein transglycosylase B
MPLTLCCLVFAALSLPLPVIVSALEVPDSFTAWVDDLREEALAIGIRREIFDGIFADLKPVPQVLELDRNQPEFKETLEQYLQRRVTPARIKEGRRLLSRHRGLLDAIYRQYGVAPCFLVALWGIETNFGSITGDFPVIAALATLAHDGRRSAYFRPEVLAALRIVDGGLLEPTQMKGSWAGAMGELQFLPSVYRRYGVDFNSNGRIDVWKEPGDIFASGANYLRQSGWRSDEGWGMEVVLPAGFDKQRVGMSGEKNMQEWHVLGVRTATGGMLPAVNAEAAIVLPDGPEGRTFLVYHNYTVLLKWNRSHLFAVGVCLLADQLQGDR